MKLTELFEDAGSPLTLYHGYSKGVSADLTPPIHFAYDKKLADLYGAGKSTKFKVTLKNPLVIQTDTAFKSAWSDAGLEEPEDAASMNELSIFQKYFQNQGFDGIIFTQGLWDKSELFQNTFGDEQVIVFDKNAAVRQES